MIMFGVYLVNLTTFILLVIELIVRIMTYKGKKINLNYKAHDALLNMLSLREVGLKSEKLQIVAAKGHLFDPFKNTISIRSFELKTLFDHIGSLHEGGHYLSINQNIQRRNRYTFHLIIISLNRLIVIPLFILTALFGTMQDHSFINPILLTVGLIFFLIASILRLSIGMYEEYRASRIAFEYVEQQYDKRAIKYAKQLLIASFCNHLILALLITIAIPLLYSMMLFSV